MPKVTIWIRKENRDWWEKNGSSGWVNREIARHRKLGEIDKSLAEFHEKVKKAPETVDVVTPQPDKNKGWGESTVKEPSSVGDILKGKRFDKFKD